MSGQTADLLDALRRVEERAAEALRRLRAGEAVNGSSALKEIKEQAADARRHHAAGDLLEAIGKRFDRVDS